MSILNDSRNIIFKREIQCDLVSLKGILVSQWDLGSLEIQAL